MMSMTVHIALLIGESLGVVNAASARSSKGIHSDMQAFELPSTSSMPSSAASAVHVNLVDINTSSSHTVTTTSETTDLCLGLSDIFVALFLIILIMMTIFGNILVVLSVCLYKRMRTFTNILLTSLATADLCVGVIVMPLALIDLLYRHNWPFGRMLCRIWATVDVLLCTASILNLCIISLDRYMAITSPLKYSRTRSRVLAFSLLSLAWGLSLVVCSPPLFIREWGIFTTTGVKKSANSTFTCVYSPSIPYRIYSALGSFYIPLLVMLSMYFKIFRVASEREKHMQQTLGTCRLSRRIDKQQKRNLLKNTNHNRCASAPTARVREFQIIPEDTTRMNHSLHEKMMPNSKVSLYRMEGNINSCDLDSVKYATLSNHDSISPQNSVNNNKYGIERESKSLVDLTSPIKWDEPPIRKNTECGTNNQNNSLPARRLPPPPSNTRLHMMRNHGQLQTTHYTPHYGQAGKSIRGSKEKIVYLRERKALKTIGIVVLGFVVCWMPFFVMYLTEVFVDSISHSYLFRILNEFFLWLGYSNSVLNPIIYTMYNGDFRRCFRDLLSFGCCQHHRRSMSVKKLHQQSTVF